jgi:predicted amidohydrolase YtcJ
MIVLILSNFFNCQKNLQKADLVLLNGNIYSVDDLNHVYSAIAVKNEMVQAVGTKEEISKLISTTSQIIDLKGKTVLPGFIESHAHLMNLGYAKLRLQLQKAKSWQNLLKIIKAASENAKHGEWIQGRGWHQEKWEGDMPNLVEGYPVHHELSVVSPDNPVYLKHASGHAVLVNQKGMELAGITQTTPDPPGGRIIRDSRGAATGVFLENASDLIYKKLLDFKAQRSAIESEMEDRRAFSAAMNTCINNGITSFHDAGESYKRIDFYKKLCDEGNLPIRLWVMLEESNKNLKNHLSQYKIINYGNRHLTVRAIKRYMDGALGSRGAWLIEPYNDFPSTYGLPSTPMSELEETAQLAFENGFQLCIHAIGDRGNKETLNLYEKTFNQSSEIMDLRWRIEHAQHLCPDDIHRFNELGVIAAMQSVHCTSDGPWVSKRIGAKRSKEGAYVWHKLISAGVMICNGTDAPVEDINPLANFYSAITRKMPGGERYYPDQSMSRLQALQSYTINGAFAAFEEEFKGSLTPGKLADMVILDKNIMTIPEKEILQTNIISTVIGGKIYNHGWDENN